MVQLQLDIYVRHKFEGTRPKEMDKAEYAYGTPMSEVSALRCDRTIEFATCLREMFFFNHILDTILNLQESVCITFLLNLYSGHGKITKYGCKTLLLNSTKKKTEILNYYFLDFIINIHQ